MTEIPTPASMDVEPPRRRGLAGVAWVWLVPLAALAVILSVAYQTYLDRGILIEITFENGSGIAKETEIRYRDITVGKVEKVGFSDGLDVVVVSARIDQEIAPYLDDDAQFWVVRPDVTLRGVSGLDTVLSGAYIAGKWDTNTDVSQDSFTGLEDAPLLASADGDGVEIVLRAPSGASLAQGAPILHKGLKVGFLDEPVLDPKGIGVTAAAFIEADYVDLVTTNTRFWDTSGFSVSVGANGLALNVDSLASLIEGGIAFDTVVSGGSPIGLSSTPDSFDIFDNENAARESLFERPDRNTLTVGVLFDETVNGLRQGSAVKYQGVVVGEVSAINAIVIEEGSNRRVRLRTTLDLSPARIGISDETSDADAMVILASFVAQGMRARLVTGNILTGTLEIELIDVPNATLEFLDPDQVPFPIVPTTQSEVSDAAATAEGVLARINDLPIEELMEGAIDLMASIQTLATDGDLRAAPEELRAILSDVRRLLASDGLQNAPASVQSALTGIEDIVTNITSIVDDAAEADLIGSLAATVDAANLTVNNIGNATGALDGIFAEIEALTAKANALEVDALLSQTTQTLARIDALIVSEAVAALPATVNSALEEVRTLVVDVRDGGAVENLNAALAATSNAARSVATSVQDLPALAQSTGDLVAQLQSATENLPQITAEIEALVASANAADIDALVTQATAALDGITTLVESDGAQNLPDTVNATLNELDGLLASIREGGAVENVNAALASASEAARAVEAAATDLPALSDRASRLVNTIDEVVSAYGERGRFNAETAATLRDIQAAADAVADLARAIQRNPGSLIRGR